MDSVVKFPEFFFTVSVSERKHRVNMFILFKLFGYITANTFCGRVIAYKFRKFFLEGIEFIQKYIVLKI